MSRFKKFRLSSLAWLLVGFIVALAWGELFTTILMPQSLDVMMNNLQADPIAGYIYEPGSSTTEKGRGYDVPFVVNSLGLRDREIAAKGVGVFRILLLGNSFSVSHAIPIEESFSRAVEAALNARSADFRGYERVEVINAANAGYSAYNYLRSYERWDDQLQPDAALVGFVAGREHKTDVAGTQYAVRDGQLAGRFKPGEPVVPRTRGRGWRLRKWLAQNSHAYVLLRNYFYYNETIDHLLRRKEDGDTAINSLRPYLVPLPPSIRSGWDLAYSHLAKLEQEARDRDEFVVVAGIPEVYQVDPARLKDLQERTGTGSGAVDAAQPLKELERFCAAEGIPVLDLSAAVGETHRASGAYLLDNHWNAAGIAAGAEAVASQWRSLGLPPFSSTGAAAVTPDRK